MSFRRMVSIMPSAVIGLTKDDAPSLAAVPSGNTRQADASTARYCEYIAPPTIATVFPTSAWAASDEPAATTVPAPSLPTGSDWSSRAASPFNEDCPMGAVTTGRSGVPATVASDMSAVATRRPRSEGLIGAASTRTNTSLCPGIGTATSCSESSRLPAEVTSERSSSAVSGKAAAMAVPRSCVATDAQTIKSPRAPDDKPPTTIGVPPRPNSGGWNSYRCGAAISRRRSPRGKRARCTRPRPRRTGFRGPSGASPLVVVIETVGGACHPST